MSAGSAAGEGAREARAQTESRERREARERILSTAEPLFLAQGLGAVTMDAIAAALRMSKKTLYQHFPSKEALCVAAIERAMDVLDAELERIISAEGKSFDEVLSRVVALVAARLKGTGLLLEELERDAPALYERLQVLRREVIHRRPFALLTSGVASGALRSDVRPELVLRVMLTMAQHVIEPRALAELGMDPADAYQQAMSMIFEGIRAPRRAPVVT
ncbi:TetR/AcrR family transcriptional regulator [Chondromyces apiculatus]|uniref:HTH tetR-type domain-containing protein n=1 Tax=Chondromyces apiculatus DSM 436 TaxID=1192034 RepID=A0A017T233_9BACT|nr:TetR/AcrR family transcriptional regulator [Chondromyces apiculatus]EYF02910.1 Hypothetical protein CAP_6333 [Chondromyces apiculatus DSM 436]